MRALTRLVLVAAVAACGSSKDQPAPQGAVAHFELAATGSLKWGDVPYPSDLYLSGDGTIDLAAPPAAVTDAPIWPSILSYLKTRKGFCTSCAAFFGIEGDLDRATLPPNAGPNDAAKPTDPVVMVDVDPASPDHGKAIPLQYEWNEDDKVLAVRPVPWAVLHEKRKYAVALTSKLHDARGFPIRASSTFAAVRDGGGDAAAERARKVLGPGLDEVARAGVARGDVVALAVFTTADTTADVVSARKLARAASAPVVTVSKIWSTAQSLDELFGIPVDGTPGVLTPAKDPSQGKYAAAHDQIAAVVYGSFQSPHVREGEPGRAGFPVRSASGELSAKGDEKVTFLLSIPKVADLTKVPVVVALTGAGSAASWTLGAANTFARAGAATLGLDPPCEGARAVDAADKSNELRRLPGPDGIPEADNVNAILRCFGLGDTANDKGHPAHLLGFGLQSEADLLTAIRLVKEGDVSAIRADAALAPFAFDPKNVFLLGNHLGNVHVTAVAAVESDLAGVMLNAYAAAFTDAILEGPAQRALTTPTFFAPLGVPVDLDETKRRYVFHPALDLYRTIVEPGEARTLLSHVYREPLAAGPRPDLLLQRPALDESFTEEAIQSAVATLGIPSLSPMTFAAVTTSASPASANLSTPAGPVTAAASVFSDGLARMMWFPQETSTFEPPFNPPAKRRASPAQLNNPIAAVHAQLEAFVRTRIATGHAEIAAPK